MRAALIKMGCLGMLGLILLGCRTMEPDIKPATEPEVLRSPPDSPRYDSPKYPREAFNDTYDPTKRLTTPDTKMGMGPKMSPGGGMQR